VTTRGARFWLRWSLRDMRRRLGLIVAIGLLLAVGTGLAAGLGSMIEWRKQSNDVSFAALRVHDLRIELEEGAFVQRGALTRAAAGIEDAGAVASAGERLIVPTQIDAGEAADGTVITPGQLIGVAPGREREADGIDVTGPPVDSISVEQGAGLAAAARRSARGQPAAMLEVVYAEGNGIEAPARIEVAGGQPVDLVGLGTSPETFVQFGPGGAFSSEKEFGTLFAPLATAQRLAGRPGQVNDLALRLRPGGDIDAVRTQLRAKLARELPGIGVTISDRRDIDGYRILYDDASNDQQLFDVFAILVLAGAALAAFNLVSRTIEAQRREIGIGMALGVSPRWLAIRPLLLGLQIGVIGVAFGVLAGLAINEWLRSLLVDQLPLPILVTDFQPGVFLPRAAIGFAIPLLAAIWPVRRGLAVTPIEAIRTGFRSARGGGLAPLLGRVPLPGNSIAQMAPRNVLRAPRRTLLTVLGSGAVVAVAVSMSGMLDSFAATVDRNEAEQLSSAPDRLLVTLDRPRPAGDLGVAAVARLPQVARVDGGLRLPATLRGPGGETVEVVTEIDLARDPVWAPRVSRGRPPRGPGEILIAATAATDLGVAPGERIAMVHPRRTGAASFATETSPVLVSGTHPDPFRFPAYMAPAAARRFGLAGTVDSLTVVPRRGVGEAAAERALFAVPVVASVEPVGAVSGALREGLDEFAAIIWVVIAIAVVLILLIAFNSTAIAADERAREHATMFAYGLPARTVLRLAVVESLIMGLLATALGIALGIAILGWVVNVNLKEVLPELGVVVVLAPFSIVLALLCGAGTMAAAPLLTVRRLRRMDVPSTLRTVE
jgi:putative ABC transport system permease protein